MRNVKALLMVPDNQYPSIFEYYCLVIPVGWSPSVDINGCNFEVRQLNPGISDTCKAIVSGDNNEFCIANTVIVCTTAGTGDAVHIDMENEFNNDYTMTGLTVNGALNALPSCTNRLIVEYVRQDNGVRSLYDSMA